MSFLLRRRRLLSGFLAAGALGAGIRPAGGVVILDSAWRIEGGRPGHESWGFDAHMALAREPQFASVMALSADGGATWGYASGTWIANVGRQGVMLTAGHNYQRGDRPEVCLCRTSGGAVRRGVGLHFHPLYSGNNEERSGYDAAIVYLDGPVTDCGPQPALYSGDDEENAEIVMIGYGTRGIGSVGEDSEYDTPGEPAAATNVVEEVMDAIVPPPVGGDAGNWLQITLLHETEGAERLDGLLGAGDSGGSAWMETDNGWVIVGINANGTGKTTYGDQSGFARVSGLRDWIQRVAPAARFVA